ncbi:hypothetical protein EX30DRAFT_349938 [Ascodesmis nigricans]|uniref:Uncharacterized protein n=1 Tax=Ascodesmis nigricans TaxID=341454 RepID=A0A4S2MTA2_9PEZI|nr:hypothetical protein EX30DRAFT_349938 [Ascodesmis nigricans]
MSTISTLCATSTVALAPCGLALAVPAAINGEDGELNTAPRATRQSPVPPPPPPSRLSTLTQLDSPLPHDSSSSSSASSPGVRSHSSQSRPTSTSKKWFRRLSETFAGVQHTSFFRSSSPSTAGSRSPSFSFSRPSSRINTSRPPTRNKLVKRPPSQLMSSRSSSPLPPQPAQQPPTPVAAAAPRPQRRPSTGLNQLSTPDQPAHTSQFDCSSESPSPRPSTSAFELSWRRQSVSALAPTAWQRYFPAKRHKIDPKKTTAIRKIVPDRLRRRAGPTLVLASAVETKMRGEAISGARGSDAISVYSDLASLYPHSRPDSRHMNDRTETTRPRAHTFAGEIPSMAPMPIPTTGRSFSFLSRSKSTSAAPFFDEKSSPDSFTGICVGTNPRRLSLSSSSESYTSSYYQRTRSTTPGLEIYYNAHEQLSVIQSVSRLTLDTDLDEEGGVRLSMESSSRPIPECAEEEDVRPQTARSYDPEQRSPESPMRPIPSRSHRLSLMSTSERASTLVGSDSEHDFGSDTLFDSIRTRMSQLTPVRADAIFDFDDSNLQMRSPTYTKADQYMDADDTTPVKRPVARNSSPRSIRTARAIVPKISLDDEDGWSTSDWDAPSRSEEDGLRRLAAPAALRNFAGLLSASPAGFSAHSNESTTTYGTAQENLSVVSSAETNSILDWDDGNSIQASSTRSRLRPKIIQAPESDLRPARRLQNYQPFRSQSLPASKTLRGRIPSENWDDDFVADDEGDMVIPHVIQERQASIIGHLGCVREFALLVEDLKRLRDEAISKNIRYGADCLLWDEADGIIALATVDDDTDSQILKREKLQRQHTWAAGQNLDYTTPQSSTRGLPRRSTALLPEDDIFAHFQENGPPTPTIDECKQFQSAAPNRRSVDRNDPIEVAKSMMERMQKHRAERMGGAIETGSSGKTHFDTDMLKDLVAHVNHLKRELLRVLNTTSPPGLLKVKPFIPDSGRDSQFNFSLTPRRSFDKHQSLPAGFDMENGAREYRSTVIGIAS